MGLSARGALALEYATQEWPVIPLHTMREGRCTCGAASCKSPGKHPRTPNGLRDATIELATVQDWWRRWPDANVGLRTGEAFTVLDVDPKAGGDETLRTL